MKLSALPQPLPKECAKAAKILKSFVDSGNNGLDGVIPRSVLENARGFAIYSVLKAGFLVSARAGSGIVIAKLEDGSWSPPSAIGTAGMGIGTQAGAELTDVLIVLNSKSAVRSFMSAGSVTLGTNLSVAVGPLGRNGEASGSINTSGKMSATYSYSKTRGLFGGISVEGSVIVERQDANALAYEQDVTAKELLSGVHPVPKWAGPLIAALESCTGLPGGRNWVQDKVADTGYAFEGIPSPGSELPPSLSRKKNTRSLTSPFPPVSWNKSRSSSSTSANYFNVDIPEDDPFQQADAIPKAKSRSRSFDFRTKFQPESAQRRQSTLVDVDPIPSPTTAQTYAQDNPFNSLPPFHQSLDHSSQFSGVFSPVPATHVFHDDTIPAPASYSFNPTSINSMESPPNVARSLSKPSIAPVRAPSISEPPGKNGRAIALYDYNAQQSGDLSFKKGDVIIIVEKTGSSHDWWTGRVNGKKGIFPANFVEFEEDYLSD
ncbi:DUF500-domain-containing protein [Sistotremastrum suecicum HHB10207 ss-3]|uniref:DUF500-domain-containing protein n=1 Tax=Sistotremastrum suecicum HHB10207 ss-3 TaxID=1314776 RepID=A0A166B6E2_9AGAM|nr:DUF500-domain-containing protein [Sistotremastrum suecicum HHB10207 ss-3]